MDNRYEKLFLWVRAHENPPRIEIFPRCFPGLKSVAEPSKGLKKTKEPFLWATGSILGPDGDPSKKSSCGLKLRIFGNPSCFQVKIYLKSFGKIISVGLSTRKSAENRNFQKALSRAKICRRAVKRPQKEN